MQLPFEVSDLFSTLTGGRAGALGGGLWAVREDRLSASASMVRQHRADGPDGISAFAAGRRGTLLRPRESFATRVGAVAVIPVLGPLVQRMSRMYWSYDEIIRDLGLAVADPDIETILLDIDSPGGMVSGCDECAAQIRVANGIKPVISHIGGLGASAAYWLATAAGEVTAGRTANIGSVGALISYLDIEGIFTGLGAKKVEVIAEQSPAKRLDPDSEEGRAELQAIVDGAAELFIDGLTAQRGVSRETVMDRYGQGRVFKADEALTRGMIDRISSFENILADLAGRPDDDDNAVTAAAPEPGETSMTTTKTDKGQAAKPATAETPLSIEMLKADHPEIAEALIAEGRAAGAEAERTRILGIEANALPGHETLVAEMKADGNVSPADAAERILRAEKESRARKLQSLKDADKEVPDIAPAASASGSDTSPEPSANVPQTEEGWRREYEGSAQLRAEFKTVEQYLAVKKAEAAGTVRYFGRKSA